MGTRAFRPFSDLHRHIYGSVRYDDFAVWRQNNVFDLRSWESIYSEHFGRLIQASDIDNDIYTIRRSCHSGWIDFHTKYQLLNHASRFSTAPKSLLDARQAVDEIIYYIERQMEEQRISGIKVTENRIHLSHTYGAEINGFILTEILNSMSALSDERATMTLAISLSRDNPVPMWNVLKETLKSGTGQFCTGVDLCGSELENEPEDIADICGEVQRFNQIFPQHAVALLIHAGELIKEGSIASSIRRVHTAARLGAHRIGHATILAMEPHKIPNGPRLERVASRVSQLKYDLREMSELAKHGVRIDRDAVSEELRELERLDQSLMISCAKISEFEIKARQNVAINELLVRGTVVECCPTANVVIGGLDSYRDHPIRSLMDRGLTVVLATDNAGLFSTSLDREYSLLEEAGVLSQDSIDVLEKNSRYSLSENLSCRRQEGRVTQQCQLQERN